MQNLSFYSSLGVVPALRVSYYCNILLVVVFLKLEMKFICKLRSKSLLDPTSPNLAKSIFLIQAVGDISDILFRLLQS